MSSLNKYLGLLQRGQISRRDFMYKAAALGMATPLAATLASKAIADDTPSRGGHLGIALDAAATSDTLDPATAYDTQIYVPLAAAYNNLVELGPDKKPIPELAESWEVSTDAKEWIFNIRKGIEFHDGKTLDANDVVYSLRRHIGPDTTSSAKGYFADVAEVTALDTHQVKVTMHNGNADLHFALTDFHAGIVPDGYNDWISANGTGGYRLTSFEPGVRTQLERNPNYWKSDRAWVDSVEIIGINDNSARVTALKSGTVDAVNSIEKKVAKLVENDPKLRLVRSPGGSYQTVVMRTTTKPFQDNNLRMAMKYGVDREQILGVSMGGYGAIGNDHPIPPSDPYYNTELPQKVYDPEKAKWYLDKAGVSKLTMDLHTSTGAYSEAIDVAALYKESSKSAGIDLNLIQEPADGYWSNVWMKHDLVMSNWGVRPTPDLAFSLSFACGADWNESFWCNDDFTKLLFEARITTDESKRKELYWTMQEIASNDGGNVIFVFSDFIDGYSKRVRGAGPDAVREMMGCRICERVWLDI